MAEQRYLDAHALAARLRERALNLNNKTFLVSKFEGTDQATDLTLPPNCRGFGRLHHFRFVQDDPDWVPNPLPIVPASKFLGVSPSVMMRSQVFQLSACDFRCWYCFVDFSLLSANLRYAEFVSARQLLEWMVDEGVDAQMIDLGGGQPELVPEYPLWFLQARSELGLDKLFYIWADDNLSTDFMWQHLNDGDIAYMTSVDGYSRVGCLKGFDAESFSFNTTAAPELFDRQIELLGRTVRAGFDQYGYITLTNLNTDDLASKMAMLFDAIQTRIHPKFPLRIVPLRIFSFNANMRRYVNAAQENQYRALEAWRTELQRRFSASELELPISDISLREDVP